MNYLYLLYSRFKFKIGIGRVLKRRVKQIDQSTAGKQRLVFAVLVFNARQIESWLHRRYKRHHAPFRVGSGKTEWYTAGLWVLECAILMLLIGAVHLAMVLACALGIIYFAIQI